MICGGSPCFVAGTKVITKEGYKNIENIKTGDMVLTHKNRFMPVLKTGGDTNKDIYKLKVQGFLETECTDYHPFYCKKTKFYLLFLNHFELVFANPLTSYSFVSSMYASSKTIVCLLNSLNFCPSLLGTESV